MAWNLKEKPNCFELSLTFGEFSNFLLLELTLSPKFQNLVGYLTLSHFFSFYLVSIIAEYYTVQCTVYSIVYSTVHCTVSQEFIFLTLETWQSINSKVHQICLNQCKVFSLKRPEASFNLISSSVQRYCNKPFKWPQKVTDFWINTALSVWVQPWKLKLIKPSCTSLLPFTFQWLFPQYFCGIFWLSY